MTVTQGAAIDLGALPFGATQPELFDVSVLEADLGVGAWAPSDDVPDESVALHGTDTAPGSHGIARFLGSEAFRVLADRDRSSAPLERPTLVVEVRLAEAGHVFTVASVVERELRRLESVTADAPSASVVELASALADGRPTAPGPGGLRIVRATGSDAALTVVLEPLEPGRTPLSRWPRLALGLAASAVADLGFDLADSSGARFSVGLSRPRNRVVGGGLPDRAVTMVLSGRQAGVTRQVTVVTTGARRVRPVDPSVN